MPTIPQSVFLKYDTELDEIERDSNGRYVTAPLGTPGLLVAEITNRSTFDGYTNRKQTEKKVLRVSATCL